MPNFSIFHLLKTVAAVIAAVIGLSGCKQNVREPINPQPEQAAPISASPAAPVTIPLKKRMENALLRQAQHAFSLGHFTTPAHSNAYDKFQSVLLINPHSDQARAGLQAILLKYAQLTRLAISEGRFASAKNYLRAAEIYYPANALLMDLKQKIRESEAVYRQADEESAGGQLQDYEEVALSVSDLNRKSESLLQMLVNLAQRIEETEEGVLIFARSDREGRWIYKQMKDAVPHYRVRGDIRISKSPKIRILPPF